MERPVHAVETTEGFCLVVGGYQLPAASSIYELAAVSLIANVEVSEIRPLDLGSRLSHYGDSYLIHDVLKRCRQRLKIRSTIPDDGDIEEMLLNLDIDTYKEVQPWDIDDIEPPDRHVASHPPGAPVDWRAENDLPADGWKFTE